MQPYLFPYIGYFQLINAVDKYILYDELTFIKDAWINRNRLLNKGQNKADYFTIPLESKSSNKKINQIKISDQFDWKRKFLNKVYLNYKRAPYFDEVYYFIETMISSEVDYISDFNKKSIIRICDFLDIDTLISTTESYFDSVENDIKEMEFKKGIDPIEYPIKVLRVLEFCKNESANEFYNSIGGKSLYSKETFRKNNIDLSFIKTDEIHYTQFGNPFVPSLSIIDVMMFNSKDEIQRLLDCYSLE